MRIDTIGDHEVVYTTTTGAVYPLDVQTYPDTMPLITRQEGVPVNILLRPKSFATFMAVMFWVDAIRERVDSFKLHLILPFLPGARQDRMNPTGDYLFTAKSIAREINMRKFDSVHVLDPHSEVAPALIDRCDVRYASLGQGARQGVYAGVISPDAGAEKRAGRIARELGVPLYHAWKTRDVKDGKITGFGCEPFPLNRHYLIADDICDGGNTFLGLANVFKGMGPTFDLYVSHGLFTQGTGKLLEVFKEVITTNSTIITNPGVTIIDRVSTMLTAPY